MTIIRLFQISLIFAVFLLGSFVSCADLHITCDFDLEPIELILPHLPEPCQNLYNDRLNKASLYKLYREEAQQFGVFQTKLDRYERRETAEVELTEYPFDARLREDIYGKVDIISCVTTTNDTAEHFIDCVKQKRIQLIDLIPNAK